MIIEKNSTINGMTFIFMDLRGEYTWTHIAIKHFPFLPDDFLYNNKIVDAIIQEIYELE